MEANTIETPLTPIIKDRIQNSQHRGITEDGTQKPAISFQQYMMQCLYHPEFGYYRGGATRVGREGDFYTSAYIGELMGEQLAQELNRLANQWFRGAEAVEIIDWGGGTGRLGRQMLDEWERLRGSGGSLAEAFGSYSLTLIEGNAEHRKVAEEELASYRDKGQARVLSMEDAESLSFRDQPVIIVANELLDAFPVHRLVHREGVVKEWGVTWQEDSRCFIPCLMELSDPRLLEWLEREKISVLENQTFEVNLDSAQWIASLAGRLGQALVVLIDYGDELEELFSAHRMDGTLLCYYKHRAHNDPYILPGEQDITSHVNFSHIRSSAVRAGFRELSYNSQKNFLIESGLLNKLTSHHLTDPFHPIVRRNRAIRQLLLTDSMSELFKVQILLKSEGGGKISIR